MSGVGRVLVVNAGSSSLKLAVVDEDGSVAAGGTVERWSGDADDPALRDLLEGAGGLDAVGHRVVHGGPRHDRAVLVDDRVLADLESVADLAPLHNPAAVRAARAVRAALPDVPAVACFDTAFHAGLPEAARTYALPREWNERWSLRRYGFHGLSHAWAVRRGAELAGLDAGARTVSCHLGAGASLAAVRDGRSLDTTMGFTPLEGLVMATRSGSVDPGLLLWLQREGGVAVEDLQETLERRSGLAGLSGTGGDLRDVLAARAGGDAGAALAYDVALHRLAREAAAMTAATAGLDLLVLTGGVGENSAPLRADLAGRLAHLGVAVDPGRNASARGDADVTGAGAAVRTVVVTAREDLEIAGQVREVLSRSR